MVTSPVPAPPVRVLVVDGQEIVRRGVIAVLQPRADVVVVGEAGTLTGAQHLVTALAPDVVLLDTRLPDGPGTDLCRELARTSATVRCLFLTADTAGVADMAAAGAVGHLLKDVRGPALGDAVVRAAAGASWDPGRDAAATGATPLSALALVVASLTERESAVLRLITDGLTNRQIGSALFLSEKTVKNYVSGVLAKLGVQRRTQAAVLGADARDLLGVAS